MAGVDPELEALTSARGDARAGADRRSLARSPGRRRRLLGSARRPRRRRRLRGIAGAGKRPIPKLDDWERIFAVNVQGFYLTARAVIPHLRRSGGRSDRERCLQLGLVAARTLRPPAKGAVVQLTWAMAYDRPRGTRASGSTACAPGRPTRPFYDPTSPAPRASGRAASLRAGQLHAVSSRQRGDCRRIAYLLSPSAGSTMGAALVVRGYTVTSATRSVKRSGTPPPATRS